MKHTDSLAKLAPALVAAQRDLKAVSKDAKNPHFKNTYASLDAIIEAVRPTLAANGLAVVQGATVPMTNENGAIVGFAVETMLVHMSGEWLTNTAIMPIQQASPQGAGGALTYGRRYGLSALLALATEEDDDGNGASRQTFGAAQQAATNPATAPVSRPAPGANGSTTAHSKRMPFGKNKGTALGEIDSAALISTIEWCSGDFEKKEKFKELIASCEEVLNDRGESVTDEIPF
jgi:hypothetical protein